MSRIIAPAPSARPDDALLDTTSALVPLASIARDPWRALAECALEANGFYLPDWCFAVDASARSRTHMRALTCWSQHPPDTQNHFRLIGLLPVVSLWRAWKIPLPALVSADAYAPLGTPLLARDQSDEAARGLISAARATGAHALVLRDVPHDGPAMAALSDAARRSGATIHFLSEHRRACLEASHDAEKLLRQALGGKKLKELRRLHNRLADLGPVHVRVARQDAEIDEAIDVFLRLESSGWKGRRGTALASHDGDTTFIRRATKDLAALGQCQIITLCAGKDTIAAAIMLRHHDQAFYFKLGIDEGFARFSPGVQLTLAITRQICADPTITHVDSMAIAHHPMIDPIWRGRKQMADVLIALPGHSRLIVASMLIAIRARQNLRIFAKRLLRFIRPQQEKMS